MRRRYMPRICGTGEPVSAMLVASLAVCSSSVITAQVITRDE
ncbi:MAG TPA: hypothetical protein VFU26_05365 [Gaiellaceae bacterium]|nr:hypothetical protein [Gaiellaceae bacterium]